MVYIAEENEIKYISFNIGNEIDKEYKSFEHFPSYSELIAPMEIKEKQIEVRAINRNYKLFQIRAWIL